MDESTKSLSVNQSIVMGGAAPTKEEFRKRGGVTGYARTGKVEIELLGPMSIKIEGRHRPIRAKKVRALLAMLALSASTAVSFDELFDELWSGAPLRNPKNALHANVLRLRKQLEVHMPSTLVEELLLTSGNGYTLNVSRDSVDVDRFEQLAVSGAQMIKRKPSEAVTLLTSAVNLWRGPALIDAGDGIRCKAAAIRLGEERRSVQEDLMEARLELGGDPGLIAELAELVTRYPERERLSELLMLALYRGGRQADAVDVFHKTRHWLVAELGAEPGRSLRAMYQSILVQDPLLALARPE